MVLFDAEQFAEVDGVVNPLWLDVLFSLLSYGVLAVTDHVRDGLIIAIQGNLPSEGKDNELKRVPGHFRTEVKLEVSEQQIFIVHLSILKLLIDLIPLLIVFLSLDRAEAVTLIGGRVFLDRRVLEACVEVEFVVDELEKHDVEVQEGGHDSIIYVDGQVGGVLERHDVGDVLAHYLRLVVHSFDANEHLLEGVGADDVELEVAQQLAAEVDLVPAEVELLVRGEDGEEGHEGKRVVEVAQGVHELRVALPHEMVEADFGLVLGEVLDLADVALGLGLLELLEVDFLGADALDDGVESKEVDILKVVVSPAGLLEFFWGFARIDALEDAEPAEILEGELQLLDGLGPAHVFDHLSSLTGFYLPHRWLLIINYNQIGLVHMYNSALLRITWIAIPFANTSTHPSSAASSRPRTAPTSWNTSAAGM